MKISYLPQIITVSKNKTFDQQQIPNEFNKFFLDMWPKLGSKIPELYNKFQKYLERNYASTPNKSVSINELKQIFFVLKLKKSAEYDDISFDVVRHCFGKIYDPLMCVFNNSLKKGCISGFFKKSKR